MSITIKKAKPSSVRRTEQGAAWRVRVDEKHVQLIIDGLHGQQAGQPVLVDMVLNLEPGAVDDLIEELRKAKLSLKVMSPLGADATDNCLVCGHSITSHRAAPPHACQAHVSLTGRVCVCEALVWLCNCGQKVDAENPCTSGVWTKEQVDRVCWCGVRFEEHNAKPPHAHAIHCAAFQERK